MFGTKTDVSPEIKKLRQAIIDAIDSCDEKDDEAVWVELLSFLPDWRYNLERAQQAKIRHAFLRPAHPQGLACRLCGEVSSHQAHGVTA